MAGPTRTSPKNKTVQPPRPPNAWILYRSEKSKALGRKAQADVSKEISAMWKNELPAVRAEYERRADIKKAEHQAMYPEYRFQPVKREERDRQKEERRQDRERKKQDARMAREPNQALPVVQPVPIAAPLYYVQQTQYGLGGPSPPISAAASPDSTFTELPRVDPSYPQTPVSAFGSPSMPPASSFPSFLEPEQHRVTSTSGWQPQLQPESQDFLEFDIPTNSFDQMHAWANPLSAEFESLFSGDSSAFQLQGFDPQSLLQNPEGNLEISFSPFDLPAFDTVPLSDLGLFTEPSQGGSELSALFFDSGPSPEYGDQFLNLDEQPSEAQDQDQDQPTPAPYVPPSGASQASTRRVGGTWPRPSSPLTSPIAPSWTVHA